MTTDPAAAGRRRDGEPAEPPAAAPPGEAGASLDGEAPRPTRASELIDPWRRIEERMRAEYLQVFPAGEEVVEIGRGPERFVKRAVFRVIRPLIRRYDRLVGDVAALGRRTAETAAATERLLDEVASQARDMAGELRDLAPLARDHEVRIGRAATELELLARRAAGAGVPAANEPPDPPASTRSSPDGVPDDFYQRFELELRGSPAAIDTKLGAYRDVSDRLRAQIPDGVWLDLGCGDGRFLELLRSWGWDVRGMDISPQAVEACRAKGLVAVVGSLPDFLVDDASGDGSGEVVAAISLIQVIEHLPTDAWLPTLRYAERRLAPGGQLVVETIDPRNPDALQAFFADVTHTWAAHPETLRVMATFAGFVSVEVRDLNPGDNGKAQDFALIATKA